MSNNKNKQIMLTTVREYSNSIELRKQVTRAIRAAKDNGEYSEAQELENNLKVWESKYFNLVPTVYVSFMVGYRLYYRSVVKLGKSYFTHGDKMTKSNGYRAIEEIEAITEKMTESMIADSYYY